MSGRTASTDTTMKANPAVPSGNCGTAGGRAAVVVVVVVVVVPPQVPEPPYTRCIWPESPDPPAMPGLTVTGSVVQSPGSPEALKMRKTFAFPLESVLNGSVPFTSVKTLLPIVKLVLAA